MAKITQYSRISHHTIFGTANAGLTFSIPTSEDFTDGTWTIYDLAMSEIGVNEEDKKVYIRIDDEIKEFEFVGGTAGAESLADTLAVGNTTGGNNIVLTGGDEIVSGNGGSFITLDYSSTPDRLYMGQTNSYVDLNNGTTRVVGTSEAALRVNGSNRLSISSDGTSTLSSSTFSVSGANVLINSDKYIASSSNNNKITLQDTSSQNRIELYSDSSVKSMIGSGTTFSSFESYIISNTAYGQWTTYNPSVGFSTISLLNGAISIQSDTVRISSDVIEHYTDGTAKRKFTYQPYISTSDATPTTLHTFGTTTDTSVVYRVLITAHDLTNNLAYMSNIFAGFRNDGGTVNLVGTVDVSAVSDFTTATSTIGISGTDIIVRVTGEAGKTINWTADVEILRGV